MSKSGKPTPTHFKRKDAATAGGFHPQGLTSPDQHTPKPVNGAEQIALADMLNLAYKITGNHHVFMLGIARILLELGYKP